ncbi:MAG TPA: exonuclease domain-containing protein [Roseovarius sp.]
MRTSLRLRVLLFFLLIGCGNIAAIAAGALLAWRRAPEALPALTVAGLVAAFGAILITALIWLLFDEHVARAINRLAAALRARAHGGVTTELDISTVRHLGDLGPASGALCRELADMHASFEARLDSATRQMEEDNAHLAALLSEIPVAVMLVDEAYRIILYDRQCVHALGQVAQLGLGRSVFDYLDREALEGALADLAANADVTFIDVNLPTADGKETVSTRVRHALQGGGFMLSMEVEGDTMAERPLVFDFGLTDKAMDQHIAQTPLSALSYVVFDSETTGLDTEHDEIVQVGAVRVLSNRIVQGETFDTLVNPGRPIPGASSRIHGITDEMVGEAPDPVTALRRFHGFAQDGVLVAHNAPFDLAFLKRHEGALGLAFDHPVLDTVLLSAIIFGEGEIHTLDAIADRLDIHIDGSVRHTAVGDAIATAQVLVRLLPMLEAHGVHTFGDVITAMRRHARLLPDLNRNTDQ